MDVIFLILFILDGIIVGKTVSFICRLLIGDRPVHRLIRLLLSLAFGVLYTYICMMLGYGESDISIAVGLLVFLAPIAFLLVILLIDYMFSGQNSDSDDDKKSE